MKLSDIDKVKYLRDDLMEAVRLHGDSESQLRPGATYHYDKTARIQVSSKHHGASNVLDLRVDILSSMDIKRMIRLEISNRWGVVVGLRVRLRQLGVVLD